jgi:hypothetical protein
MTNPTPFAQQLVSMVRQMPDEAILDLVRNHLESGELAWLGHGGAGRKSGWSGAGRAETKQVSSTKPKKGGAAKAKRVGSVDRATLRKSVLTTILSSAGVSLGDVAAKLSAPKPQVAAAIRLLKAEGKIQQGGERRLARYAKTKTAAKKASRAAQRS